MLTDEQLVARAQRGDDTAMATVIGRYENVAFWNTVGFYSNSADQDDLHQEARIGVFKAVRDYKPERGATFKSFAFLCAKRQLFTAIKNSNRLKHETLTWASRSIANDDGDEIASVETVEDLNAHTDRILDQRAQVQTVVRTIADDLTVLERESIIGLVFLDESYTETEARILGFDAGRPGRAKYSKVKVVDNALSRARRKLARALAEADAVPLDPVPLRQRPSPWTRAEQDELAARLAARRAA